MMERNRFGFDGEISFECDECDAEIHTEISEVNAAIAFMKNSGWKVVEGSHLCPSCASDEE